ncbi:hypothetical protein A4A49_62655, partial [Nicotiana attenuata]
MGKSGTKKAEQIGEKNQEQRKESTAQWVSRAFAVNKVTMNQSCQEIPSQAIDPEEVAVQELIKQKVKWTGGKLWDDQTEDDPDEGDLSEGYEEEKVPDEETQGSNSKVQQSENYPSPLMTIDPNNSIPTLDLIPAEPIDLGDPCGEEEQQIVEKDGSVEKEKEITLVNNQNAEQLAKVNAGNSM